MSINWITDTLFAVMGMFGNIKGLAYYQPGEADPYITINDVSPLFTSILISPILIFSRFQYPH